MNPTDPEIGQQPRDVTTTQTSSAPHAKVSVIPEIVIGSHFKMIWITITGLTIMLAFADILLSILIQHPTAAAQQAISMCDSFAKVGFGGIFGMIGAKAIL
jgi:hypothetical protein